MNISKHIFSFLFLLLISVSLQAQTLNEGDKEASDIPLSADAIDPLKEGSKIPSITLTTPGGDAFNLNAFVAEQPVVLVFYRGGWCPYCNTHLQELMEADPRLRSLGFEILAISADRPAKLAESLEKHEMTYKLLSDSSMIAAKAFGVAFKVEQSTLDRYEEYGINLEEASGEGHQLLPVPSVFIVDRNGVIRYVYSNPDYKTRLKSKALLKQAEEAL